MPTLTRNFQWVVKIFYIWVSLEAWQRNFLNSYIDKKKQGRSWRLISKLLLTLQKQAFRNSPQNDNSSFSKPIWTLIDSLSAECIKGRLVPSLGILSHCENWRLIKQWSECNFMIKQWLKSLHYHQNNLWRKKHKGKFCKQTMEGLSVINSRFYHSLSVLPKYIFFQYFTFLSNSLCMCHTLMKPV